MQKIKKGSAVLLIFFITTIILFIGLCVIKAHVLSADIVYQQHYYWKRYYHYEGCLEYALAYFYKNEDMRAVTVSYISGKNEYHLFITSDQHAKNRIISVTIAEKKRAVAAAEVILEKNGSLWHIKNRTLMIQLPLDLDKKALLSYTKVLKK